MYPKFIEVHDGTRYCVNVNEITYIHECGDDEDCQFKAYIGISSGAGYGVDETYDEVKQLITDSGCLIKKADPRLDMAHPLTMTDIMSMVGEPVWTTSISEWGLVTKDPEWHEEIQEEYFLRYHDGTMTVLYEEGLKKYPLYRMRQS